MPLSTSLPMFIHLSTHLDIFIHFIHTTSFAPLGTWNWTEFYSFYKIFTFNIFGTWANIATENCGGLRPFLELEPWSWKRPLNSARGHTPAAWGTPGLKCFAWPKWYFLKWEIPHKLGFQDLFFLKTRKKIRGFGNAEQIFPLSGSPQELGDGSAFWRAFCRRGHLPPFPRSAPSTSVFLPGACPCVFGVSHAAVPYLSAPSPAHEHLPLRTETVSSLLLHS